jgi:archaellum component FlaC
MATSSINIQPVKYGSEIHNNRQKELEYVRKDLSYLNEHFNFKSIESAKKEIENLYIEKVGQKMQAKSEPIREAVLIIEQHHTIDDLAKLADQIENRFGIKAIQGYIHKDEGHFDEFEKWNPNLHAHLIFDWQDKQTGKSIKLNRQDMSELQTLVSEGLKMQRGISSDKKHLNATAFKIGAEKEKLNRVHKIGNDLEYLEERKRMAKDELNEAKEKKDLLYEKRDEAYRQLYGLQDQVKELKSEKNLLTEELSNWLANKTAEKQKIIDEMNKEIEREEQAKRQSMKRGYRGF